MPTGTAHRAVMAALELLKLQRRSSDLPHIGPASDRG
jgi:hypothetical protein